MKPLSITVLVSIAVVAAGCGATGRHTAAPAGSALGTPQIATVRPRPPGPGTSARPLPPVPSVKPHPPSLSVLHGLPAPVGIGSRAASCSGTDLMPARSNIDDASRATLCLLNIERVARRLRPLHLNV